MPTIYAYFAKHDAGFAPNPFWGLCTLAIGKPAIRLAAEVGDWILGLIDQNSPFSEHHAGPSALEKSYAAIFAMRITKKMTMPEYDHYCQNNEPNKIPGWETKDWRMRVGDCIYDFSNLGPPIIRPSLHGEENRSEDFFGKNTLISKYFYYFGSKPVALPAGLAGLAKEAEAHPQAHSNDAGLLAIVEKWVSGYSKNKLLAPPTHQPKIEQMELANSLTFSAMADLEN